VLCVLVVVLAVPAAHHHPSPLITTDQAEGMLGPSPEDVAVFLSTTEGLDRTTIGDYLGEREDTALKVRAGAGAAVCRVSEVERP